MEILSWISGFLWGPWTAWVLLGAGVLFSVWTRFTQFTAITHGVQVVRGVYDNPDDPGAINHFQALSAALSATVGLGNIGGVALAIAIGGPGALFWMWIVGVLGMALKTVEITLAMLYRDTDDPDNPHGGAMWVVDRLVGVKGGIWTPIAKAIGVFFCFTLIISTFTGGSMFQSWSVASLTEGYFGLPRLGTGVLMAVIVGMVIIGGIKRIGNVAAKLVPFMCILYVFSALVVLAVNVTEVPAMLALIVKSAFQGTDATGAFIGGSMGFAFLHGMQRALFSNEAGQGSAPIAHAAAKTSEPAREGIVGGIGPFIDTLCICTITALVILTTGTWNRDAIGDFGGDINFTHRNSETGAVWDVDASTRVSALPESRFGEWNAGTQLFLIAEVEGASQSASGSDRIQITATVVKAEGGTGDAPPPLVIEWDPVSIDDTAWSGSPSGLTLVSKGVYRTYTSAQLTGHAFDRQFPGLGKWLVTLAAWLFSISTMISWSYYGEQGMIYMLGNISVLPYKLAFLASVIYGAVGITNAADMIMFMNLGTGAMLWSNMPIVLAAGFLAVRSLHDYNRRLKAGEFPRHAA